MTTCLLSAKIFVNNGNYCLQIMGKISQEDKILIKNLRIEKGWSTWKMVKEFPNKNWRRSGLDKLVKKIDTTGDIKRKGGSGRPKSVRTPQNIETVGELICSQDDVPATHKTPREIERETGIARSSVQRIVKIDLAMKNYKRISAQKLNMDCKEKREQRCLQLLERFPNERSVRRVWFTDEKIFTVATPVNSQNDRVYSTSLKKNQVNPRHLIREREHFSNSVMVSVGVSKMGKTDIIFVETGAKINSDYYCSYLLDRNLLRDIRRICGNHAWTLQQDGAPSHTAGHTIEFLRRERVDFIEPTMWPPNSPDLNPVDYAIWGALQQQVYLRHQIQTIDQLKSVLTEEWRKLSQRLVDKSIDEWRTRLQSVVDNHGGHIEHLFKQHS